MISFSELLYRPHYASLYSTSVVVSCVYGGRFELRGIDKTGGVEVALSQTEIPTIQPAVTVMVADMIEVGLNPDDLIDALITVNGSSWKVLTYMRKPSPHGETDGELYIILQEAPE